MLAFYQPRAITRLPIPLNILLLLLITIYHFVHSLSQIAFTFVYNVYQCFKISFSSSTIDPSTSAVFITGCASGFGQQLALKLDQQGYKVFAGVRSFDQRSEKLKSEASDRLKLVKCDITNQEEVSAAAKFVEEHLGSCQLSALVNNAGVVETHGFEWGSDLKVYEQMLQVNVIGQIRVTRQISPLLRRNPGSRIIFVSSAAASVPLPGASAYSAAKAAISMFSSTIAKELAPFDVNVSTLEPAFFRTPLNDKNLVEELRKSYELSSPEVKEGYVKQGVKNYAAVMRIMQKHMKDDLTPVIDALLDSVTLKRNPPPNQIVCDFFESLAILSLDLLPQEYVNKVMFNLSLIRRIISTRFVQGFYPETDKTK